MISILHYVSPFYREYSGNIEDDEDVAEDLSSDEEEIMGEQDDSEDDEEDETEQKSEGDHRKGDKREFNEGLLEDYEQAAKRRRLSTSISSSVSASSIFDFSYSASPGFKH